MRYLRMGNTGIKVSQLCLGTWHLPLLAERDPSGVQRVDIGETLRIMRRAYDLGINFVDTANRYHGAMQRADTTHVGNSERIVGEFLRTVERESVVLATKVRGQMAPWPNGEGLSRKHIRWQIRESLRRLGTDYVDLYQVHWSDPDTPKLETLSTLTDLVREGKVHYIGVSNHAAHDIVEFMEIADKRGLEPFATMQEPYNVLERDIERDKVPVAKRYGMAILAYIPLAQGVLTGKYLDVEGKRWVLPQMSRLETVEELRARYFTDRNLKVLLALHNMAREKGASMSQLSLAWILKKSEELGVTIIPIIGATKTDHLLDNIGSLDVKLSSDDMKRIEEVSSSQG